MVRRVMVLAVLVGAGTALSQPYFDPFNGTKLNPLWTFRNAGNNDRYELKGGWFIFDIDAGQDLFRQGVDGAPMLLTDPPVDDATFEIETMVDVILDQKVQPRASHAGLIIFREKTWAYTLWGPYNNTDIRVEDCVGADYRWRDQAQIGLNPKFDNTMWLKIEKRGKELEFFYKDNEGDKWQSGGVDTKLGPHFEKGTYKIGLFLKNWGGSIPTKAAFDYFHSPQLVTAVRPKDKVAVTWAMLKQ